MKPKSFCCVFTKVVNSGWLQYASAKASKWKIRKSHSNGAPRQNNSALDKKVVFTHSEPEVNPILYIGCCTGKIAMDNSLYWINFMRAEPPVSPILGDFHYSALDLCYTFLQSHISVSVVSFLMNNPQNTFSLLSSRHSALFHLHRVFLLAAGTWRAAQK